MLSIPHSKGRAFYQLLITFAIPFAKKYLFIFHIGGAREDRTPDPLRAKQVLSQLSYGPK